MELSDAYIESFIQPRNELLLEMEQFAAEHHVPIMQLSGIEALNQLLRIQNQQQFWKSVQLSVIQLCAWH